MQHFVTIVWGTCCAQGDLERIGEEPVQHVTPVKRRKVAVAAVGEEAGLPKPKPAKKRKVPGEPGAAAGPGKPVAVVGADGVVKKKKTIKRSADGVASEPSAKKVGISSYSGF